MVEKNERPIVAVNLIYITGLGAVALRRENYEFVLYAGVIIAFFILLLVKQRTVRFDRTILWGLTLWGLAHLAGGIVRVGDGVLYDVQLIAVVLRYDQAVHFFGFGTATLVCHHLLRPYLRTGIARWGTLSILIVLMGCGLGAVNEVVEFVAVVLIPETGVGGYENTLWDLVFNLLGASAAAFYLAIRRSGAVAENAQRRG